MSGLAVSNLVRVTVNLTQPGALGRSFGTLCIAGDSDVINPKERIRTYSNLDGVGVDFGINTPEYQCAEVYFSQSPSPSSVQIGRWLSTASPGQNLGGILSPSQQALANWNSITNGGMVIVIDGATKTLTGLDFSSVTNLNGVASVIDGALSGGSCVWNGSFFMIASDTTGIGTKATGTITVATTPSPSDTVTINGTVVTFVASSPTGNQVLIGGTATLTAANLQQFLQNSANTNIAAATYVRTNNAIAVTYKTIGTGGNSFTLVSSAGHVTVSGSTLTGGTVPSSVGYATAGSGTDISAQLKLTSSTSQGLVDGYAAESPAECAVQLAAISTVWYGLTFAAVASITNDEYLDVCDFIESTGSGVSRIFAVTSQDTNCLSALSTTDLPYLMDQAGYERSTAQYSSYSPYAVVSMLGTLFTVDFAGSNTAKIAMWKQEPGIVAEELTLNQALALKARNCNVYVKYLNDTALLQYGTMASGNFIDTRQGCDWLQNATETAVYNVLYTTTTKVPQTDAGVTQITNAVAGVLEQGVTNGLLAPGVWNAAGFGSLQTGAYLPLGYYVYAPSVDTQSEASRAARECVPIQAAAKLAGAIQTVLGIEINVNQ